MMTILRRLFYGLVILYTLVGFFLVPYLLKTKAVDIANEKINGKLSIESASFNPYSFRLKLDGLKLVSLENRKIFSLDELNVNLQVLSLLDKTLHVKSAEFKAPYLDVIYSKEKKINLLGVLKASKDENKSSSGNPMRFILDSFRVVDGTLAYEDYTKTSPYKISLNNLEFDIKNVDTGKNSTKKGSSSLAFDLSDGGSVELLNNINSVSPFMADGTLDIKSIRLYSQWKYIKDKLNIEVADGKLDTHLEYHINLDDIKNLTIDKTSLSISNLRVKPKNRSFDILNISALHLDGIVSKPLQQEASIANIGIFGVDLKAQRIANNRIDWQDYIKVNQADEKPDVTDKNETKKWKFVLKNFDLKNSTVTLDDRTLSQVIKLENIFLHVSDLDLSEHKWLDYNFNTTINHKTALGAKGKLQLMPLQQEGELSISNLNLDLLNPYIAKSTAPIVVMGSLSLDAKESFSKDTQLKFLLENFDLNSSSLTINDTSIKPAQTFKLANLSLHVSDLASNPASWFNYKFKTNINHEGVLDASGKLQRKPLRQQGVFSVNKLALNFLNPYLTPHTYLNIANGNLNISAKESFDSNSLKSPKMSMRGKFGLNNIMLKDEREDKPLLSFDALNLDYTFDYAPNRLYINKVLIDSLYANAVIDKNKTINFAKLMKDKQEDTNTTLTQKSSTEKSTAFPIKVTEITIKNGSADFADLSLLFKFQTHIHDLNGKVYGISSQTNEKSDVDLNGIVDKYGSAKISGSINASNPKKYTDMSVGFSNLALNSFSPYSASFAGYKIDDGKLFVNLGYKINNSQLDASNSIIIKHIKLGETIKDPKITVLPLRFAVALLEDSDGIIDLDLPIKGDLNNPDFKYGAIVWKVLGNLITKAVTAPFRLLGSMLGFSGDALESIDFEPGKTILLPPEIEKLENVTKALQKRTRLTLNVGGTYDIKSDKKAIQMQKLINLIIKRSAKANEEEKKNALAKEMLEELFLQNSSQEKLDKIKLQFKEEYKDIRKFNEEYTARLTQEDSIFMPVNETELKNLAAQRVKTISDYLVIKEHLDPTKIAQTQLRSVETDEKTVKTKLDIDVK